MMGRTHLAGDSFSKLSVLRLHIRSRTLAGELLMVQVCSGLCQNPKLRNHLASLEAAPQEEAGIEEVARRKAAGTAACRR